MLKVVFQRRLQDVAGGTLWMIEGGRVWRLGQRGVFVGGFGNGEKAQYLFLFQQIRVQSGQLSVALLERDVFGFEFIES